MINVLFGARPQQVNRTGNTDGFQRSHASSPTFGRSLTRDSFIRFGSTATSPDPQHSELSPKELEAWADEEQKKKSLNAFVQFSQKQLSEHIHQLLDDEETFALLTSRLNISEEEYQQRYVEFAQTLLKPLHELEQVELAAHQAIIEKIRGNRKDEQLSGTEKKALAQQQELIQQKLAFLSQLAPQAQNMLKNALLKKLAAGKENQEPATAAESPKTASAQEIQNKIINDPAFIQELDDWIEDFETGAEDLLVEILSDPEWLEGQIGLRKLTQQAEVAKANKVNKMMTEYRNRNAKALNQAYLKQLQEIFGKDVDPDKININELSPQQQEAYLRVELKMRNLKRYLDQEFEPSAFFRTIAQELISTASQTLWEPMTKALQKIKGANHALNEMIELAQSDEHSERLQGLNDLLVYLARSRDTQAKKQLVTLIKLTSQVPVKELKYEALELLTTLKDDKTKTNILHLFLSSETRSNQIAALHLVTLDEGPFSAEAYRLIDQSPTLKEDIENIRKELKQVPKGQRTEETVTLRQLINQVDQHNAKQEARIQRYAEGTPTASGVLGFPVFDS